MLRVRESLERGEMVGILADRAPAAQKTVTVRFLGDPAPLPVGPLMLCAALGAPVVLFVGVRTGARRYSVQFEQFADRITLERSRRTADITGWVRRYVDRIEAHCRDYPFNWFNFYDFWGSEPQAARPAQVRRPAAGDIAAATPRHRGTVSAAAGGQDR
jgi:predicted LPLAT superfamily acyltransferase